MIPLLILKTKVRFAIMYMKDKRACIFADKIHSKPSDKLVLAPFFDRIITENFIQDQIKLQKYKTRKAVWCFNRTSLSCSLFTPPVFLVYCSRGDPHNQILAASASVDFLPWFLVLLDEMLHMGKYPQSIL